MSNLPSGMTSALTHLKTFNTDHLAVKKTTTNPKYNSKPRAYQEDRYSHQLEDGSVGASELEYGLEEV